MSPSLRREWIEIVANEPVLKGKFWSPSLRREWIEISYWYTDFDGMAVSLLAEGVD